MQIFVDLTFKYLKVSVRLKLCEERGEGRGERKMSVKGTVRVILKYPKYKDDNVRFKAVPFKQKYGRYRFFYWFKNV